jgi:hypothetical protein
LRGWGEILRAHRAHRSQLFDLGVFRLRRRQLLEILDQPWCPQPVRDGATDFLESVTSFFDLSNSVGEKILERFPAADKRLQSAAFVLTVDCIRRGCRRG